ncbi:MAG: tyrosine-type recombinase/integrase [Sulfitobacter sp.]|jgi:integrase
MPLKLTRRDGSPCWHVQGTVAGQRIRQSTGIELAHKGEAEIYKAKLEARLVERRARGKRATYTFAEAALAYIEGGGEARFLGPIITYFGPDTPLSDVDGQAIREIERKLFAHVKPATVNRQLITPISAVYNLAADEGLAEYRRFRKRKGDQKRTRWLTPEEAERLITQAKAHAPHLLPVLGMLLGGGLRVSEALRVTVSTFYESSGEILVSQSKNGDARLTKLPARAAKMISAQLPEKGTICLTPKGQPYVITPGRGGQIAGAFDKIRVAAELGPDVTPHVLRHTWATWFYAQTVDFGGLLDQGGWRKADMAMRYRKIAPEDLSDRLEAHGWDFARRGAPQTWRAGIRAIK